MYNKMPYILSAAPLLPYTVYREMAMFRIYETIILCIAMFCDCAYGKPTPFPHYIVDV